MAEYDVAIEYIFGLMKDGTLKVGDKLPTERAIAAELGIGRNKAREALSILSGMGMIESRQGSGNFVSGNASGAIKNMIIMMMALNTISRQEVCKFRRDMEKAVCSSLISDPPSEEMKNRIKDTLRAMDGLSGEELAKADHDFHNALVKATGNKLWEVMMDAVADLYSEWIDYVIQKIDVKNRAKLMQSHKDIFNNIIEDKPRKAMQAIEKHYELIEELLK